MMNSDPGVTTIDFEAHLLVSMKLRIKMSHNESQLEAKLAQNRISIERAAHSHEKITKALAGEAHFFTNMKRLLQPEMQDATSLEYDSVLWPGFRFKATGSHSGHIESAGYQRTDNVANRVGAPVDLEMWTMDVAEFADRFGPLSAGRKWSFVDGHLPGYEEHEFVWEGESYGAGFSWGLFMFAAMSWD
ncbi:hypothetical protein PT015_21855 [Candidatus Mycobacterium wuenschmannii]|uniref:Uncharacterized protein n=1 Tax=Candidatus Mycobacterium wuenschmannii TaxID=3027808 RepID=A0ABY8VUX4_9MYCO|nr:hypothetical protein [Candidatus Mycobacterium wuenschmannii]WIM87453.1 hypothetical protein PT015_21855 [Candidatus Mycobacterium wuenschmannii]